MIIMIRSRGRRRIIIMKMIIMIIKIIIILYNDNNNYDKIKLVLIIIITIVNNHKHKRDSVLRLAIFAAPSKILHQNRPEGKRTGCKNFLVNSFKDHIIEKDNLRTGWKFFFFMNLPI